MAVKIRLARRGRKRLAIYDIVVADARSPRDGRFIERIGQYNPNTDPASITLDEDKAFDWVMKGAQPTDTVKAMLSYRGVLIRKHLQIGVIKGALTQEQADAKFEEWKKGKDAQIEGKKEKLAQTAAEKEKVQLEAETKKRKAREEAVAKKRQELEDAAKASAAEAAEAIKEAEGGSEEPEAEGKE
ncbi:MAG: 30S ribosomal protein S16 [Cyclobacteriaceae bacterium]|nr:30S ribosomal protein S16 [Cyclobacteriaceae bacterium]MCH8515419.1 30S ribosomal protein S16 [Cyclobacteriaceae bacterium]